MLASVRRVPLALRWRLAPTASIAYRAGSPSSSPLYKSAQISSSFQCSSHTSLSRSFITSSKLQIPPSASPAEQTNELPASDASRLSTFSELSEKGLVHQNVIDTITKGMKFDRMTEVQSLTIAEALTGVDVLAQAKTGTGKTMAFLLPIIQRLLQSDPRLAQRQHGRRPKVTDMRALVISPTRELAEQIASEARRLTRGTGLVVQLSVGGTQKKQQLTQMHMEGCHILVGTPGRIKDVFSDPSAGVSAPQLNTLVLDEADRLLDDGFWPEVQAIQSMLPDVQTQDRQTLMFSATVPRDVVLFARSIMKRNLHYVQTVREDDVPTTQLVDQKLVVVPTLEYSLPTVLELCEREIKKTGDPSNLRSNFKALIYFNTTAEVELAADMFENIGRPRAMNRGRQPSGGLEQSCGLDTLPVLHIHSKLTQAQRTRSANTFRAADSAILLSSDVTARGMDFPNVTHVIQIGISKDGRDTYVHRIGRTARAGKAGQGWLIIPSATVPQIRRAVGDMPLQRDKTLETPSAELNQDAAGRVDLSGPKKHYFKVLQNAARACDPRAMRSAYRSLLGANVGYWRNRDDLVEELNRVSKTNWGLQHPPGISSTTAKKLGYFQMGGLNIREDLPEDMGPPPRRRDFRGQPDFSNRSRSGRSSAFDDFQDTRPRPMRNRAPGRY